MKRVASILWLSIGLVAVSVLDGHAQQSFPLICRGGGQMKTRAHAGNAQHTFNILGLFFTKANRPAGPRGRNLTPGQCSWVDRGLRANEPDILQREVGPAVNSAPWFADMKNPAKFWIFDVFNTNQGVMKITRARPQGAIDDQQ
jgi:hypothetical protein